MCSNVLAHWLPGSDSMITLCVKLNTTVCACPWFFVWCSKLQQVWCSSLQQNFTVWVSAADTPDGSGAANLTQFMIHWIGFSGAVNLPAIQSMQFRPMTQTCDHRDGLTVVLALNDSNDSLLTPCADLLQMSASDIRDVHYQHNLQPVMMKKKLCSPILCRDLMENTGRTTGNNWRQTDPLLQVHGCGGGDQPDRIRPRVSCPARMYVCQPLRLSPFPHLPAFAPLWNSAV